MTLAEALESGTATLRAGGSPSARLDAEVLLAHLLGLRRVDLYAHPERMLSPAEEARYQALLERRTSGEPVSYLVGWKEFYGLTLAVDRRVMIPRPETEVLVERALVCARMVKRPSPVIADVGTGSGCIAVALARELPQARLYATEISPQAAELARENLRRQGVEDRVTLLLGDLCAPLPEPVDVLVSNPPYTIWATLPPGITSFEPRVALDGGSDGLEVYRRLLPQLSAYLRRGGFALLEIGDGQAPSVLAMAEECFPGVPRRTWPDYSGEERVVEIGPYLPGDPTAGRPGSAAQGQEGRPPAPVAERGGTSRAAPSNKGPA